MLKIKDNVDLKELEKFGLEEKNTFYTNEIIAIAKDDRFIYHKLLDTIEKGYRLMMIIARLCQAGLVEKVGGKSE